jgi:magnesium transporter
VPEFDTDASLLDELHALLRKGEEAALEIFLRVIRPEDIAEWLDLLSTEERQRILSVLDHNAAGAVLTDTTASIRAELVEEIEPERLARIAEALPADEAADLIGELEVDDSEKVLHHITTEDEEVLRHLLTYPEDTAGGLMNPDVIALQPGDTVDDAIRHLRSVAEATPIVVVYVVDEERRLLGFVRMRRMVIARPSALLGDIMSTDVISVPVDTDQEEVADIVDKYDFMALPVVDAENRLLGVVTVDDILSVIEEEATEDIYKMAGSSIEEEESESILHVARYRLPWLLVCLAGTQLSSLVLLLASKEVRLYDQMSVFTAAIMAMAGNTSLQSSTTTVRRLALDTLPRSRYLRHITREIVVAFVMGVICGVLASALAVLLHHNPLVGLALGPAMAIGMSAASLLGAAMPMVLDLLGIDPAVASGPLVSTINDSLALAVYFSVATGLMLVIG